MTLHVPTLLFVTTLVVAFSGALLIFARGPRREAGAVGIWGAAMLLGALGFLLVAVGQGLPWISDGLATGMFLAATAVSWTAARVFAERPPRPWLAGAGPAGWLLMVPVRAVLPPSPWTDRLWLALACIIGAAYTLATAAELWRLRSERLPSRGAALFLLIVHATLYGGRGLGALLGRVPGLWAGAVSAGLVLESLLHTVGMAFILLSMMKERVEVRASRQLRALALQDGLTGIANRRQFEGWLDAEVRRAQRRRAPLALLMMDVDHFKLFNDAFGHPKGDACLRAVAGALASLASRPGDLIARYGGEEFAVLLADTSLSGAMEIGETLRIGVMALGLPHRTLQGVVTISVGVAALQPGQDRGGGAELVQAADRALYRAKAGGRNRVMVESDVPAVA